MAHGRKIVRGVVKYGIVCGRIFICVYIGTYGLLYSEYLTDDIQGVWAIGYGWPFGWFKEGGVVYPDAPVGYTFNLQNLFLDVLYLTAIVLLINGALKVCEELGTLLISRKFRSEKINAGMTS